MIEGYTGIVPQFLFFTTAVTIPYVIRMTREEKRKKGICVIAVLFIVGMIWSPVLSFLGFRSGGMGISGVMFWIMGGILILISGFISFKRKHDHTSNIESDEDRS